MDANHPKELMIDIRCLSNTRSKAIRPIRPQTSIKSSLRKTEKFANAHIARTTDRKTNSTGSGRFLCEAIRNHADILLDGRRGEEAPGAVSGRVELDPHDPVDCSIGARNCCIIDSEWGDFTVNLRPEDSHTTVEL